MSTKYAYDTVPRELDPFDDEEYKKSDIPFYAVVTNIRTGKPEYVQIKSVFDQMDVLRASGSMPVVSKPVKLGHEWYLDGAVTDSIPYEHMLDMGYDRVVVVLTKPADYIKSLCQGFYIGIQKRFRGFMKHFQTGISCTIISLSILRSLKSRALPRC